MYQNQSVLKLDCIKIKVTQKYHEYSQTQDSLGEAATQHSNLSQLEVSATCIYLLNEKSRPRALQRYQSQINKEIKLCVLLGNDFLRIHISVFLCKYDIYTICYDES